MSEQKNTETLIRSFVSPLPGRDKIFQCIQSIVEAISIQDHIKEIALLCAASEFLARFAKAHPQILEDTLRDYRTQYSPESLEARLSQVFPPGEDNLDENELMYKLRLFKKSELLRITLRFLTGVSDIQESMSELTMLAEVLLRKALDIALSLCKQRYGEAEGSFTIIGLGKLGAEELNYSSDIDIIGIYDGDPLKETTGIIRPSGVRGGQISLQEFYIKVMETLKRLLNKETEQGLVYRVDLRLRPQGQRSPLVHSLKGALQYYLTWGRTWERMVLIRARPVAGDQQTGKAFMDGISEFLWLRRMDYSDIEEIRQMKKKIDATFTKDDIKRGYGGIREIEFFVQSLQLMYSPEFPKLRTHKLNQAIEAIAEMKQFNKEDLILLWQSYLNLRKIEHLLQMRQDLQTHRLPSDNTTLSQIAWLMGFSSVQEFLRDLRVTRIKIKKMYNDLLGTEEDIHAEALALLTDDFSEEELKMYLDFRGAIRPERALQSLLSLREAITWPELQSNRRLINEVLPLCLEEALNAPVVEEALFYLEEVLKKAPDRVAFLRWFKEEPLFMKGLIRLTGMSSYMRRLLSAEPLYLSYLIEDPSMRKTRKTLGENLSRLISAHGFVPEALVRFRQVEQLRAGIFYALEIFTDGYLQRTLTKIAEVAVEETVNYIYKDTQPVVVAMGKFGSREMDFQSDIDILFIDENLDHKKAESLLRILTEYTDRGPAFQVDMRLRPDGSKGPLVHSLDSYKHYYLQRAAPWEVQALLRARPLTGSSKQRQQFMEMVSQVLRQRAKEITWSQIQQMRERIIREVSKENQGIDIKFGPGGIEEIEFFVQYMLILRGQTVPNLSTTRAIRRLARTNMLTGAQELLDIYQFLRKLYTVLRLNEETILKPSEERTEIYARVLKLKSTEELSGCVISARQRVLNIIADNIRNQ